MVGFVAKVSRLVVKVVVVKAPVAKVTVIKLRLSAYAWPCNTYHYRAAYRGQVMYGW